MYQLSPNIELLFTEAGPLGLECYPITDSRDSVKCIQKLVVGA